MAPLEMDFDGYWGKPTSTIDWCEANYEVTYFIAEFCEYSSCHSLLMTLKHSCNTYNHGYSRCGISA